MRFRTKPQQHFDPKTVSVLVVDDNAYMRAIVGEVLRAIGVGRVLNASSGAEALEEINAFNPDVLIVDWEMSPMNGIELVERIRAGEGPDRAVPVIMISAYTRRIDIEAARRSGVDEFVAKPITTQKVVSRLQEVCTRTRPFVESSVFTGPCRRRQRKGFQGPFRRLDDPFDPQDTDEFREGQRRLVVDCVQRVHDMATELRPGDRMQIRAIYSGAGDANAVAKEARDEQLTRATASLVRYLQGVGATDRLQIDVVATHLDAIIKIVRLNPTFQIERESLAQGLERVVTRKLQLSVA
jgi:CheY-like chemotaxis protein